MQSYILLTDKVAHKQERGLLSRQKGVEDTLAFQGSFWKGQGLHDHERDLNLTSLDFEGVVLRCKPSEVGRLSQHELDHLVALNACTDRYNVYKDKDWLMECLSIERGDIVYVLKFPDLPEQVPGKVKYKGLLPGQPGIWYGVELTEVGTILGILNTQKYA